MTTTMKLDLTKGLVKRPDMLQRIATGKIEDVGMNRIGPRVLRGICWHRGLTGGQSFEGAVEYLIRSSTAGLTDGYISHVSGQMARMTGDFGAIDAMTPWAQGPWNAGAASSDALAFMRAYEAGSGKGVSVWNSDLFSIEVTGDYGTPISDACKRTMIQVQAAISHDCGVHWDAFPILPNGISTMFSHREGCGTAYKLCAGDVVWTYINSTEFIDAVKAVMKAAQTGGKAAPVVIAATPKPAVPAVTYAPLLQPSFLKREDLPFIDSNGTRYHLVTDQYRARVATPRLQTANRATGKKVGPDMKPGEDANISFVFTSAEDGQFYGLSSYGTCFLLADFTRTSDLPAKA